MRGGGNARDAGDGCCCRGTPETYSCAFSWWQRHWKDASAAGFPACETAEWTVIWEAVVLWGSHVVGHGVDQERGTVAVDAEEAGKEERPRRLSWERWENFDQIDEV